MGNEAQNRTFRVVISGYYGFRNSGDEAVLKSILLALQAEANEQGVKVEPVVLSIDPLWTASMYGVESVHRMRPREVMSAIRGSDGLISGGGSLLQDATSAKTIPYYTGVIKLAQWLGKPTFIYSQGIGPVSRRWMDPLIRGAMRRSAYVSVRDAESAELLARIGVVRSRIEVVPDPVMGLPLPGEAAAARASVPADGGARVPVVGVSLRHWRKDGADLERAAEALAALARSRAVRLRFLPFHTPDDAEASSFVMERLGELGDSTAELAAIGEDPQQMLLEVSRCELMVGMRLHSLIYAANARVPMLGISYDPKIDQFLQSLGLSAVGTTERIDADFFTEAALQLLDDRDGWNEKHWNKIKDFKEKSKIPAKHIILLLRQMR
ncbi:polysaccharide pyruvyl transferase CsaB [Paenibacillus tarimensis]